MANSSSANFSSANSSGDRSNLATTFVDREPHNLAGNIANSPQISANLSSIREIRDSLRLSPPASLAARQIIGDRYEVIRPLNSDFALDNGNPTIYLVRDCREDRASGLVLELIQDSNLSGRILTPENFEQQVKLINKLATQGQIPKLLAHGVADRQYYVVYEQIRGESLAKILNCRSLSEAEIVNLAQDMARIHDLLLKSKIVDCHFLPHSILKSKNSKRYVLANLKELFWHPPISTSLSSREQQSLFQEQLRLLGSLIIQSVTEQKYDKTAEVSNISANWYQKVNFSPKLQNILAKMVASDRERLYQSLPQIIADFQPLVRIDRVIGEKYRLIRYLGTKNGIQTYLARNISLQKANSSLLIAKQTTIAEPNLGVSAEGASSNKVTALELTVRRLQQIASQQKLDLVWEQQEEQGEVYLIRSYQEGISLNKRLNQEKPFSPPEIIDLLTETLQSLQLLHQQQLIHRNLKPSNLISSKDSQTVTLVDWGILQGLNNYHSSSQNRLNQNQHSHQPPEQIVGRPTASSDLYALGIVAIEALTGLSVTEISPYSPEGQSIWREKLVSHPFLIEIIAKMICPDVATRYQSATEILADLEKQTNSAPDLKKGKINSPKAFKANSSAIKNKLVNLINKPQKLVIAIAVSTIAISAIEVFVPFLRPQYHLHQGQKQLTTEPKIALTAFEKAIELQPKKVAAWQGKGEALLALKEARSALAAYEQAIKLDLENVESWRRRGDIHYSVHNFQQALESYNRVLELDPENALVLADKGKTLATLSRYPEALNNQEKALGIAANTDAELLSQTARTALALGKYNQAVTQFTRVQDIAPSQPNLWQDKVIALQHLDRDSEISSTVQLIRQSYEQALEKEPHDLSLWLGRGDFFHRIERYRVALNAYEQAIAINPNSETPWLGKAKLLRDMQQYPAALSTIERALRLQPQSFIAWYDRGKVLQKERHNLTEAVAAYDMAIAINADFFPAWRDRGLILIQQQDYKKAVDSLQKAVSLAPQDIESWLNLSKALSKRNKLEEAIKAIDRAIVLQPRNSSYWLQKGLLWERKRDNSQACATYLQGVQIAPNLKLENAISRLDCK